MKICKILFSCLAVLLLMSCQGEDPIIIKIPQIPDPTIEITSVLVGNIENIDNDIPSNPSVSPNGDGTKSSPYNCASVINLNSPGTEAWVMGYIIGYYDYNNNSSLVNGAGTSAAISNLAIADNPNETNIDKTVSVQLPVGEIRDALNLVDHPENLSKLLTIKGSLNKYFGLPGVKELTAYELKEENNTSKESKNITAFEVSRNFNIVYNYNNRPYSEINIRIIPNAFNDEGFESSYYVRESDIRDEIWKLQGKPFLNDLTANNSIDNFDYYQDDVSGLINIETQNGINLQRGHTYEISVNVWVEIDVYYEEEIIYGLNLPSKRISKTYTQILTFTIPPEE